MENLTERILEFIRENRAVFYSDIARKFGISVYTARDHVEMLSHQKLVTVTNKGVAKLVLPVGGMNQELKTN